MRLICHISDTSFTISLIDNVHSDIARLRGFYGIVHVDGGTGEIVLTEARSGEEQVRCQQCTSVSHSKACSSGSNGGVMDKVASTYVSLRFCSINTV